MPFKPYIPETYASREDVEAQHLGDVVYHFHSNDEVDCSPRKRKRPERQPEQAEGFTLPLRPHIETGAYSKTEPPVEDDEYKIGSKRRASVGASSAPVWSGISLLRALQERAISSESEYEFVESPGSVEEASDSDSDSTTLVEVKHEELEHQIPQPLPIRERGLPNTAAENDSDSDWTLL